MAAQPESSPRYQRGALIAQGGFGAVYKAVVVGSTRAIAWKETLPNASEEEIRRFKREVRMQRQLAHPNIMPILSSSLDRDPPVFVMPLADSNLRQELSSFLNDPDDALDTFLKICAGVSHAHREGVIHRDLKPENILFVAGEPRVSDFGLGREIDRQTTTITQTNMAMGTIAYMAPEQMVDGKSVEKTADVYALGKMLFELLTGEFPFPTMDLAKLDGGFRYVVEKATKIDPTQRFGTVDHLVNEVTLLTEDRGLLLPGVVSVQQAIDAAVANPLPANLEEVLRQFAKWRDDSGINNQFVPRLPSELVAALATYDNQRFSDVVECFCNHVSGSLTFGYVDIVADFLVTVFQLCDSLDAKKAIAIRLIEVGPAHNRWHARFALHRLLARLTREDEIMLFRDVVVEHPHDATWNELHKATDIPEVIRLAAPQADE